MNAIVWILVLSYHTFTPVATFASQADCENNRKAIYTYTKDTPVSYPTILPQCVPITAGGTLAVPH